MSTALRFTKQQDFCLRLGLLKLVLAVIPAKRTSIAREELLRRFHELFVPLRDRDLRARAEAAYGGSLPDESTVVDALLFASGAASWGQPIVRATAYKAVEWATLLGLVGAGNKLTDRGHLIQCLFRADDVDDFRRGNPLAWNPFLLTPEERGLFFYHLGERDELLWELAAQVGKRGTGTVLTASDARKLLSDAMERLVRKSAEKVPLTELPRLRVLRELQQVISCEVNGGEAPHRRPRAPAPRKRTTKTGRAVERHHTKNADHQTIPRFEMLVDLGFVDKPRTDGLRGKELHKAMNAWSFRVTEIAERFAQAVGGASPMASLGWQWTHFGTQVGASGLVGPPSASRTTPAQALEVFLEAYADVRRPMGHTPFENVAVLAMLRALRQGRIVEVAELHRMCRVMKSNGGLDDVMHFAAGNEVERMFITVKEGSSGRFAAWLAEYAPADQS